MFLELKIHFMGFLILNIEYGFSCFRKHIEWSVDGKIIDRY